jgi:hypothetical protein
VVLVSRSVILSPIILSRPLSLLLSRCSDLLSPFLHCTLHEQPRCAVCVVLVGCIPCPPHFPQALTQYPRSVTFQASSHLHSFCMIPFTGNPGMPPWLPLWGHSWFLLLPGGACELSVLSWTLGRPASLLFSASWISLSPSR